MKFRRDILDYLGNWAKLKGISFTYFNNINEELLGASYVDAVMYTKYKFINQPDIKDGNYDKNIILSGSIVWAYLTEEPLNFADRLITEVERKLCNIRATDEIKPWDDITTLYPKTMIMSPDEHRAYMDMMKRKMNSVYGAGNYCYGSELWKSLIEARRNSRKLPFIQDVIFNEPATIVFWKDGTKTVVKAQDGEEYDPEKGLAMAISKKVMGNTRDYYLTFKKYLKKYEKQYPELPQISFDEALKRAGEAAVKMGKTFNKKSDKE